jgi:glycosyltransferase involved in cell wall biosynthesis
MRGSLSLLVFVCRTDSETMHDKAILALIPAWNEASRLQPVVETTRRHLPVLVVDDGSQDDTAAVAEEAGATVVSHVRNEGKGVALMTGFDWALGRGYDGVLTLDADGQHDPNDIPRFLSAHQTGRWDLIIGKRSFDQMPFPRGYTNPFGSWLLSLALGERIPDNQSGFRLHDRRLLETLNLTTTGFELEVEVIVQAICQGMRIRWIEIRTIYFHPVKDSARFLRMVWHAWRCRQAAAPSQRPGDSV